VLAHVNGDFKILVAAFVLHLNVGNLKTVSAKPLQ